MTGARSSGYPVPRKGLLMIMRLDEPRDMRCPAGQDPVGWRQPGMLARAPLLRDDLRAEQARVHPPSIGTPPSEQPAGGQSEDRPDAASGQPDHVFDGTPP